MTALAAANTVYGLLLIVDQSFFNAARVHRSSMKERPALRSILSGRQVEATEAVSAAARGLWRPDGAVASLLGAKSREAASATLETSVSSSPSSDSSAWPISRDQY